MSIIKRKVHELETIRPGFAPAIVDIYCDGYGTLRISYLEKITNTIRSGFRTYKQTEITSPGISKHTSISNVEMDNGGDVSVYIDGTRRVKRFLVNERNGIIYIVRQLSKYQVP